MGSGFVCGPQGESLFTEPLIRFIRETPIHELFSKTADLKDDRLLAIVTALIVEDRIDAALASFLPRYSRLTSATDFTFSMKIALTESFAFIPTRVLSAATVLRKIRNEFAHHLRMESFSQIKPQLISDLKNLRAEVYGAFGEEERTPKATILEEYKAVAFYCIAGLDAFRENLSFLRRSIENPTFIEDLYKRSMTETTAEVETMLSQGILIGE